MSHETRDKILETAARLFHEQGFAATGIATILREAGVNSGSLYHFFPGKEALLTGVLEWYEDGLRPMVMDPIEADEPDPIERIFALLAWYREGMTQTDCRLGCPLGNLALEVSDTYPQVRPHVDINFVNWASSIEGWLREADDRLPENLDRGQLSRFVLTVMEGGLMQARAASDLGPFDDSVAQLRAYFGALQASAKASIPNPSLEKSQ